jgi:hypothetical protein
MTPPVTVPMPGGFDYVTVDPARRRVYAAHGGAQSLLIVDADTGAVLGQVKTGEMHGVAVDPVNGHVYTGDGTAQTIDEVDPVAMKVVRSVPVPGPVDAIAYDPGTSHIYADEDDGTRVFVVDTTSFTLIKTIVVPGHKPEYLNVDPATHRVYQNISDLAEVAVIDPNSLDVASTFKTPELTGNHPLEFDAGLNVVIVGGTNGVMSVYTPDGTKKFSTDIGKRFDQCDLDRSGNHVLACAGSGGVTLIQISADKPPAIITSVTINPGVHTVGVDPKTHHVFAVWGDRSGTGSGFVQGFALK